MVFFFRNQPIIMIYYYSSRGGLGAMGIRGNHFYKEMAFR